MIKIKTLNQWFGTSVEDADAELEAHLNAGWIILNITVCLESWDEAGIQQDLKHRIVTLQQIIDGGAE